MSQRARNVAVNDPLSKAVKSRCKKIAEFVKRNGGAEEGSPYNSGTEDESEEATSAEEEKDDPDLQGILAKMGSAEVKPNKTFSDDKLREIERRNAMLMDKIIKNNLRRNQYGCGPVTIKETSAAINRRRQQEKINRENLVANQ